MVRPSKPVKYAVSAKSNPFRVANRTLEKKSKRVPARMRYKIEKKVSARGLVER